MAAPLRWPLRSGRAPPGRTPVRGAGARKGARPWPPQPPAGRRVLLAPGPEPLRSAAGGLIQTRRLTCEVASLDRAGGSAAPYLPPESAERRGPAPAAPPTAPGAAPPAGLLPGALPAGPPRGADTGGAGGVRLPPVPPPPRGPCRHPAAPRSAAQPRGDGRGECPGAAGPARCPEMTAPRGAAHGWRGGGSDSGRSMGTFRAAASCPPAPRKPRPPLGRGVPSSRAPLGSGSTARGGAMGVFRALRGARVGARVLQLPPPGAGHCLPRRPGTRAGLAGPPPQRRPAQCGGF